MTQDVVVNFVGKYRYWILSPAEHSHVPLIVDIILVGRTKIITLHSSIWVENCTDKRLSFRLHVPITPLVAPLPQEAQVDSRGDAIIGPLKPGQGSIPRLRFLPLEMVLAGIEA